VNAALMYVRGLVGNLSDRIYTLMIYQEQKRSLWIVGSNFHLISKFMLQVTFIDSTRHKRRIKLQFSLKLN
jgi:hypothetical protein